MLTRTSLEQAAKKLASHLQQYGLTPSTDIKGIRKEYKKLLFGRLLEVDPGLKARHDMLRTEEARQKLLEETISLDGYTELQEAERLIRFYTSEYNNAFGDSSDRPLEALFITADAFMTQHGCCLKHALAEHVIDLTDNETYQKLQQARDIINSLVAEKIIRGDNQWMGDLGRLLKMDFDQHVVSIDDNMAFHKLGHTRK